MVFEETKLKDAFIIDIERIGDERGFFARAYCEKEFEKHGIPTGIVQANISYNKFKHTLRGLHYQAAPFGEAKLVRCTKGSIFDVIIDMRENSETFKQWISVELNENSHRMLYVPEGFAHGFMTLEDHTEVTYHVSEFYTPAAEKGIRWNDPEFQLKWPENIEVISEKDKNWPDFKLT
jgi:dTDP-4-dehydrorhamnose 3,5-epimerase